MKEGQEGRKAGVGVAKSNLTGIQLKKFAGAIQISNAISIYQRKIWNCLLLNAYQGLQKQESFEISVSQLKDVLNINTHNYAVLTDCVEGLAKTSVRWGIVKDEETDLTITTLLASARFSKGKITYEFSQRLKELLYEPEVFGMININFVNNLKSKYALALYENAMRYLQQSTSGASDDIEFATFVDLLGGEVNLETKYVKRDIIEKAVKEVNTATNIQVDLVYGKVGKKINTVKMLVKFKEQGDLQLHAQEEVLIKQPLIDIMTTEFKLSRKIAESYSIQFQEEYLLQKIEMTRSGIASGKIKNPGGFFRRAVEQAYEISPIPLKKDEQEIQLRKKGIEENKKLIEEQKKRDKGLLERFFALHPVDREICENQFRISVISKMKEEDILYKDYKKNGLNSTIMKKQLVLFLLENPKLLEPSA